MSFFAELKRRNVFKIGVAYAIVAWLLIQIVATVFPILALPDWTIRFITIVIIIGFPIAVILAWIYELTPEGIKVTTSEGPAQYHTQTTGQRLNYFIIGVLVLVVALLVVDKYLIKDDQSRESATISDTSVNSTTDNNSETSTTEQPLQPEILPNSVAVLPFENLSPNPDDAYFAKGLHDEVITRLGKLHNLSVISRTSVLRYEKTNKSIPEIAHELNVKTLMEGSVRYADNRVRINAKLIDAIRDNELWAAVYERDFADIFAIQADIATNIALALEAKFTQAEKKSIERRPTDSVEAYELYLQGRTRSVASTEDYQQAMALIDRALSLDNNFSLALAQKSALLLVGLFWSFDHRDAEVIRSEAERAALRAVELTPDSGIAHSALANVARWRGDWITAEEQYREALAVGGESGDYGFFLLAVGKAEQARDYFLKQKKLNPLDNNIAMFIGAAYDSLGDARKAMAEYQQVPQVLVIVNQIITQLGTDDNLELIPRTGFEDIMDVTRTPEAALAELHRLYTESPSHVRWLVISPLAARFGDAEFALTVMENAIDWMPTQTYMLWRPVFSDVRSLPQFKELMTERGLVKYWRKYGWPDFCKPVDKDDFECE